MIDNIGIEEIILLIIDTSSEVDEDRLTYDSILRETGVDSLDMMSLFLAVQDKYGVMIKDEDIDKIQTATDILEYINMHK